MQYGYIQSKCVRQREKIPLNTFSSYSTLKLRFEKFLIFIWKGRGAQIPMSDATNKRR